MRAFYVPDTVPSTLILHSQSENRDRGFKNMAVFLLMCGCEDLQMRVLLTLLGDPAQLGCSSIPQVASEACTPPPRIMLLNAENEINRIINETNC